MIKLIFKYKLWQPLQTGRFLYYNFKRIYRTKKSFLFLAKCAVMDLDKTARIKIQSNVILGWCNMKGSRLETALCMGENSKIILGGVKIVDKF